MLTPLTPFGRLAAATIIHYAAELAVQSTALFLVTGAALLLLRRASAATRHLVGAFGLTAALLLPFLSFAMPRIAVPLLPDPRMQPVAVERLAPPAAPAESAVDLPDAEVSRAAAENADWRGLALSVPEKSAVLPAAGSTPAPPRPANRGSRPWLPIAPRAWLPIAVVAWGLGAIAILARLSVGWSRVRRMTREAAPITDPEWLDQRDALARQLGITRTVAMLESAAVPVAMTAGVLRPLLLIARAARQWARERRRVVLLHELAHVKRGDWPSLLIAELAVALYWFHPLAWWLSRRVRRDAEQASDDLVISAGTKPSVYAGHLLGIFRSLTSPAHPVAPALAIARPHHFEERLRAILDPRAPRRDHASRRGRFAAMALVASAFLVAAISPWKALPAADATVAQHPSHECPKAGAMPAARTVVTALAPEAEKSPEAPDAVVAAAPGEAVGGRVEDVDGEASEAGVVPVVASEEGPADEKAPGKAERIEGESAPDAVPAVLRKVREKVVAAAAGFVQASKRSPKDGGDWYGRAMSLHREERYPEAIEAFQKAIDAGYREETSAYNIACGYARMGDNDKAFEWLHRAMEMGFDVGGYLGHDDDLDNLESDPRWAELKKTARGAKADKHKKESVALERRIDRLTSHPPTTGEPFFNAGREGLNAQRYDLAAKAYAESAARGYRVGTSLYNEACARSLAGDKPGALDALQRSLDAGFDQPDMFRKDDDLDAIRDEPRFAELQREAKELSLPGYGTGWWHRSSGNRARWRESARRFEEYAQRHPEKGRAWFNLGYASLAGDRPEAAVDAFRKALDLGYRKPTSMYDIACAYARLDQKDQAFEWLFKALDAGFEETGTLRGDDDLDNLRGDPRYRKALEIARNRETDREE